MFYSIQAMTMTGIVSPGTVVHDDAHRANVPWRRNGCAWARRTLKFEAISRDHPDGHAQVPLGAVAASQVPVLAWP
jgi:hypothetical protein